MSLSDPQNFYRLAGKVIPWILGLALVLFVVGFYLGFFVCPVDARQGNSYRIIFIHVSAAWLSMLLYVLMAVFSAIGLWRNNRICFMLAQAMAPTGALMAFIALFSGAFWGRPTWGTYWVWDARLTSELILFFLYLGFIALHSAIDDKRRADRAASVISIVGVINVPIIYFSVQWWNTLHQGASITSRGSSIAPIMLYTLLIMVVAGMCYGAGMVLARTRSIILERERRENWTRASCEQLEQSFRLHLHERPRLLRLVRLRRAARRRDLRNLFPARPPRQDLRSPRPRGPCSQIDAGDVNHGLEDQETRPHRRGRRGRRRRRDARPAGIQ